MFFQRYYLGCLAHASYLIADEATKIAAVIDPQRDIDQYVEEAEKHGFEIRYVFLTHFHADFVAGHIELRDRLGANIYLGAKAEAEYEFTPVKDGDVVEFGDVRLQVMATPGHTPEGVSILVFDLAKSDRSPHAVLTGDTLFIGDVGRPDLLASIGVTSDELAEMLYQSIHDKLMQLPDETLVYPAHGAGSMCGKNLSDEAFSTIGEQRKHNYAVQPMTLEAFKEIVTAEQPEAPDYFVHDAILNRQDRASLEDQLQRNLKPLDLAEVLRLQDEGAQLLDVREPVDFEAAHLSGSINVGLDGKYATWCGTVLDKATPIVVIAESGREEEAVMRLGRIGFDQVAGFLAGGPESITDDRLAVTERITATTVAERLTEEDVFVLDVRTPNEFSGDRIPGAVNIPLNHLQEQLGQLPNDRDIIVHCQGGYRSAIAASLLKRGGLKRVYDMVGGMKAWLTVQKQPETAQCERN